jgi:hypothetical protein
LGVKASFLDMLNNTVGELFEGPVPADTIPPALVNESGLGDSPPPIPAPNPPPIPIPLIVVVDAPIAVLLTLVIDECPDCIVTDGRVLVPAKEFAFEENPWGPAAAAAIDTLEPVTPVAVD